MFGSVVINNWTKAAMQAVQMMLKHPAAICVILAFLSSACQSFGDVTQDALDQGTVITDAAPDSADLPESDSTGDLPDSGQADIAADGDGADVPTDDGFLPDETGGDSSVDADVIDPEADSDGDGIPDLDEISDGTDPLDPSDARAWQPGLGPHPRLFFDSDEIPAIAAKLAATEGPDAVLAARIRAAAGRPLVEHPDDSFDLHVDRSRGQVAENAAFLALLEADQAMLDKAVSAVTEGYRDPGAADLAMDSDYDLLGAEALASYCQAWDWLAGNPMIGEPELIAVRESIVTRIDDFRRLVQEGPLLPMMLFARNNHVIKVLSSLGLCAMALNDRREAARDMSHSLTGIQWVFVENQLTPDGGHAEGCHYLTYGSDTYLPFFFGLHRWADGKSIPARVVGETQPDNPAAGQIIEVQDFATSPAVRAAYRLSLETVTPDGLCPSVDDSNGAAQHGAILATMLGDDDFLWQWHRDAAGLDSAPLHALSLVAFNGLAPPLQPEAPLDFTRYGAGISILRTSWEPDALYILLCGEHGPVRVNGLGHEHPDELAFIAWAHGKPLIIDPGYINYENHSLVFRPTDHNTILVDGKGSRFDSMSEMGLNVGNDAFLSCPGYQGDLTWTAVSTAYEGVDFHRQILRVRSDYLVVHDVIRASQEHAYTLLLNGKGGGTTPDSSFQELDDGAIWTNQGVAVRAMTVPLSGIVSVSSSLEEHNAPQWGQWLTHRRLAVNASMPPENAGFLTVLAFAPSGGIMPELTAIPGSEGISVIRIDIPGEDPEWVVSAARSSEFSPEPGAPVSLEKGFSMFSGTFSAEGAVLSGLPVLESAAGVADCGATGVRP